MTLGEATPVRPGPPGLRVVMDLRPLQDPDRAPVTAAYLGSLLDAYQADPLPGESFAFLLRSDLDDPTGHLDGLEVIGRRLLPPTGRLHSAAQTLDPFLLRGASLGAAWRAERQGAAGAVYHAVGAGTLPIASRLPVVITLLDLAPWEIPGAFTAGAAARFGRRLRGQQIRDAAAVIVGTGALARAARRLLHVRADRLRVVPLAPRPGFAAAPGDGAAGAEDARRLGLIPGRFLVYSGRYDVRQDLTTLLRALADLAREGRPREVADDVPWPPRVLLTGATPEDRASLARAAARVGMGEVLAYAPALTPERASALLRASRGSLLPVVSEGAGLAAVESIASGTPVIASAVGALPELVGAAGLLVEPRDPTRLATALRTIWADDRVHRRIWDAARDRATTDRRTWGDVADETRRIYADVGTHDKASPTAGRPT